MDEIVAQAFGVDQRLVTFGQRHLDVNARGRVGEGQQRGAVRQRLGSTIEHNAIIAEDAAIVAVAPIFEPR